jgi:hypothetical protein
LQQALSALADGEHPASYWDRKKKEAWRIARRDADRVMKKYPGANGGMSYYNHGVHVVCSAKEKWPPNYSHDQQICITKLGGWD